MLPENAVNIDISLNSCVITERVSAKLLTSTIECLIYMKNQIPFPYETFQQMANKLKKEFNNTAKSDENNWNNFLLEKQRSLAVDSFEKLNLLLKNIIRQFETHDINQALVLFGSTVFTPKEAFIIKLPQLMKNHFSANHMRTLSSVARNLAMSIMTSEQLYDINLSSKFNTTNVFVLLNPKSTNFHSDNFHLKEAFHLPENCKTIILNLINDDNDLINERENCCNDLIVFNEFDNITISNAATSNDANCNGTEDNAVKTTTAGDEQWYESNFYLKGYKDVLIKGKNIWTI